MLAVLYSGLFKAPMNQKDAEGRAGAQASVDLPIYDCFREFYSGMQIMRGRAWFLLQNPRFVEMLSLDLECMNNKRLQMESEISGHLQGVAKRMNTVLGEESSKLRAIIEKHLKIVNEALKTQLESPEFKKEGPQENKYVHNAKKEVDDALAALNAMEKKVDELRLCQQEHRANYKRDLVSKLEKEREPEVDPTQSHDNPRPKMEKTKPKEIGAVNEPVEKPPKFTEEATDFEIKGNKKLTKPKPKPAVSAMTTGDFEKYVQSEKQSPAEFVEFGDKQALSGGNYTWAAVAQNNKEGDFESVIVHKRCGDHDTKKTSYHSMIVDKTGKSAPYDIDPSDKTTYVLNLCAYGDYLISFLADDGPLRISKNGVNVYTSKTHKLKQGKCKHYQNSYNTNRNVQLEGDMLYFIDKNCHVVQYNLKELLSLDEKNRDTYQPAIIHKAGACEDFCVFEGKLTTLTKEGILTDSQGHSVDLKTLESGKLGQHFLTLETLAGFYVVASFTSSNMKVYSVLSAKLELLACHSSASAYPNQNMLLFVKNKLLHILGCCDGCIVDVLVFNDKRLELLKSHTVSNDLLNGLVWLKPNQQALVVGSGPVLKRINLS